jgi:C4-dicarboxylate-specific signal transduction histidine kinase
VIARGVSLDITQRKAAEFEAQQRRDEVAHLSRVAMLGELSGSLAHELNQPLTAILTNAQAARRLLARDQFDAGEVQEILQDIISADQRAGDVIASLRQLFRKGESSLAAVDINVVIDDVLKLVRSDLLAQRIAITRNLHPDLPAAWGDAVQLRQVLLNLVMNAADAMEGNAGTSQLSIRTEALASGEIGVWVVDTGRGVPDASLATIFEPFHTTKTGGLGLGLTICRSILTAHRSRLTVANGEEGGAVFSFELQPAPTADA